MSSCKETSSRFLLLFMAFHNVASNFIIFVHVSEKALKNYFRKIYSYLLKTLFSYFPSNDVWKFMSFCIRKFSSHSIWKRNLRKQHFASFLEALQDDYLHSKPKFNDIDVECNFRRSGNCENRNSSVLMTMAREMLVYLMKSSSCFILWFWNSSRLLLKLTMRVIKSVSRVKDDNFVRKCFRSRIVCCSKINI